MKLYFYGCTFFLNNHDEDISMKLSELAETLGTVLAQLTKAKAEIVGKIADLEDALGDVTIPPAAQDALAALAAKAQAMDDLVADVEAVETALPEDPGDFEPSAPDPVIPDDPDAPTEPGSAI